MYAYHIYRSLDLSILRLYVHTTKRRRFFRTSHSSAPQPTLPDYIPKSLPFPLGKLDAARAGFCCDLRTEAEVSLEKTTVER